MDEPERLDITLFVLNQIPTLWIWDDFQTLRAGGRRPAWPEAETEKLHALLAKLSDTQARMLIVSRDSEEWMKVPLRRRRMTALPMRERFLAARALMQSLHFPTRELERWTSVIEASQGNPMLLRALVRQALHEGLAGGGDLRRLPRTRARPRRDRLPQTSGPTRSALSRALDYVMARGFGESELNRAGSRLSLRTHDRSGSARADGEGGRRIESRGPAFAPSGDRGGGPRGLRVRTSGGHRPAEPAGKQAVSSSSRRCRAEPAICSWKPTETPARAGSGPEAPGPRCSPGAWRRWPRAPGFGFRWERRPPPKAPLKTAARLSPARAPRARQPATIRPCGGSSSRPARPTADSWR